jgi:hypothetical protein
MDIPVVSKGDPMNPTATLVASSSGTPPIVTSSAQALIPAMVGALAFIVAASVTVLAYFMQSEKATRHVRVLCALGIVYLLVASFCSLRDAIYALTTRPPETLPALRGVAWTILFPALCGLVALGVVACVMMVDFVYKWAHIQFAASKEFELKSFLMLALAFGPVALVGTVLSPYRIILLPDWLVRIIITAAVFAMWLVVRSKTRMKPIFRWRPAAKPPSVSG